MGKVYSSCVTYCAFQFVGSGLGDPAFATETAELADHLGEREWFAVEQ